MANITMELVGVYFNETRDLTVPDPDPATTPEADQLTVRQIMDLFREFEDIGGSDKLGGFDYMTTSSTNPMFAIRHFFPGGLTRSGTQRMAGVYELRETSFENGDVALGWQYYVLDANGNRVSRTNIGDGFSSFLDAKFPWAEGWQLIWRLVAIRREPLKY